MAKKSQAAFDPTLIRVCTDRLPPREDLARFARLARGEEPSNMILGLAAAICPGVIVPLEIAFVSAKKWANGRTLAVAFMGGTSDQQEFTARTAERWSDHANLKFHWGVSAAQSDLRVTFDAGSGAWSYVGTDCLGIAKSEATLNLGWLDEAVVLHEFGHALGAIHEHQHPESAIPWNRPAVYRYFGGPPNYWDRRTIDHNIFGTYSRQSTNFSEYDRLSIMHYAIDRKLLLDPSFAVGWNADLSAADARFAAELYPKPPGPPEPPGGSTAQIVHYDAGGNEVARYRVQS